MKESIQLKHKKLVELVKKVHEQKLNPKQAAMILTKMKEIRVGTDTEKGGKR